MKKVLLVVLSLLTVSPALRAKDKDKEEEVKMVLVKGENSNDYYYESVTPVEGVTKEEIYTRGKQWILTNLKTVDNNINFDDNNFAIVTGGNVVLNKMKTYFEEAVMTFKMSFEVKDNRYRIRLDNVVVYMRINAYYSVEEMPYAKMQSDERRSYRKINANLTRQVNDHLGDIIEKFSESVKGGAGKSKSDW